MNIAIPIYGSRVMPRFGCTREMIIVSVEDGRIVSTRQVRLTPEIWLALPAVLAAEQVSVLICGGIDPRFQQAILGQKIQLVWGVIGEWQDVLQAYLDGTLQSDPTFCLRRGSRRGLRLRRGRLRR
jgi:predicted Fe-Mo cluster-binding NifX family protein